MTLWKRTWCFYAAALFTLMPASAEIPSDEASAGVRHAVLGIMSYTKWPGSPARVRLCVVGQPGFAATLFAGPMQFRDTTVAVDRRAVGSGTLGEQCDAVYAGALGAAEGDELHRQLLGHAVLTITEDDPQCSGSSMFCLDIARGGAQVGFSVNLDSVARSGVAVNPRVLLLGRRRKAPP